MILGKAAAPAPGAFAAFLPDTIRRAMHWWDAWCTLSFRERDITSLVDGWSGASLQHQLSLVSVSVASFLALLCKDFSTSPRYLAWFNGCRAALGGTL